jgi:hypothetical protein
MRLDELLLVCVAVVLYGLLLPVEFVARVCS